MAEGVATDQPMLAATEDSITPLDHSGPQQLVVRPKEWLQQQGGAWTQGNLVRECKVLLRDCGGGAHCWPAQVGGIEAQPRVLM